MDFEPTYTPEQEEFRGEVSAWLREHVPTGVEHPADPADLTWEQYQLRRELGRKLGDKGWLWPTAPKPSTAAAAWTSTAPWSSRRRSTPSA